MSEPANFDQLMSTANKMHDGLESIQTDMASRSFSAQDTDQLVRVTLNGQHTVQSVHLEQPDADPNALESALVEAFNLATAAIFKASRDQILKMTSPFMAQPDPDSNQTT